jgi:lipoprotein-releasing system permease protein
VLDRYEQQDDTFRIMKIEKLIAYIFLTFILMVACFNIIGSLSMLIIDKKDDVVTLRNLGATDTQITRIFLFEGRLIAVIGAAIGIALGLLLCWLQQTYGFVKLGSSSGSFVVNAYPVSVHPQDILLIFVTVLVVGFLAVWYPVRYFSRRLLG